MRILLVEDEHYAAKRLKSLILEELPDAHIVETLDTVEDTCSWFASHVEPDLAFMDIQLADGLSFQIFEKVKVNCPVIFTTAYDEYALDAFKVNSIDYLLKPIEEEALTTAINKYQNIYSNKKVDLSMLNWNGITKDIFQSKPKYKQRFLIKTGNTFGYLNSEDIAFICSEEGLSFAFDHKRKRYHLEQTIEKLSSLLDPTSFFRLNRKYLVHINAIQKIHPYFNNRLKLDLSVSHEEDIIVSRDKVKQFKAWIDN